MSFVFCIPRDAVLTSVGATYTSGGGSLTVKAGDGTRFGTPSPTAPVRFVAVAASAVVNGAVVDPTKFSVFVATGVSGDVLTVTRESGVAQGFAVNDVVFVGITAQDVIDLQNAILALQAMTPTSVDLSNPSANLNTSYPPSSANRGQVLYCGHSGERDTRWQCVRQTDGTYQWEQF